jgi:hypothetical protein
MKTLQRRSTSQVLKKSPFDETRISFSISAVMILFTFFLLFEASADCDHSITVELGVHQHNFASQEYDHTCINFTVAPFAFVPNNFGEDTLYREYSYTLDGSITRTEFSMRFLPLFQYLEDPFHSIEIYTPSPTDLSFMTVNLPGMCQNGIYFSTTAIGEVVLSRHSTGFHNLSIYDDKCLVFGPQESIDLTIDMTSDDFEDQLFIHHSYTNYTSLSGNATWEMTNYSSSLPLFLRLVADDLSPPDMISVSYEFTGPTGRHPRQDIMVPVSPLQVCDRDEIWCDEALAVAMLVVTSVLVTGLLLWICIFSIRQTSKQERQGSSSGGASNLESLRSRYT